MTIQTKKYHLKKKRIELAGFAFLRERYPEYSNIIPVVKTKEEDIKQIRKMYF